MWKAEKLIQTAIGALIGTLIVTAITGRWAEFLFSWVVSIPFTRVIVYILFEKKAVQKEEQRSEHRKEAQFVVSEYLDRMERANLDIMQAQEPVDQIIILWWGLDGLRMNEDGSLEWISRKKQEPANQNVSWTPCQTGALRAPFDFCQTPQAQINALQIQNMAAQMQMTQNIRNAQIVLAMQSCASYPQYIYGGIGGPVGQGHYSALTNCCGNWMR